MAHEFSKTESWVTSKQAREQIRISSCELMHLRESGKLRFRKQGNAFFYQRSDVQRAADGSRGTPDR